MPADTAQATGDAAEAPSQGRLRIALLTGFLGSGKTTCLNAFLRTPEAAGIAVLVNEFGELDVDGAVLAGTLGGGSRLIALPNGCVCCAVRDDLAEVLVTLIARRDADGTRACVIETTGLADPGAILRGVGHDPRLRRDALVDQIVVVCAADRIAEQLDRFPEPGRQIGLADRIIVSKTDRVAVAEQGAILARIAEINPLAELRVAVKGGREPGGLFAPVGARLAPPAADREHTHTHGVRTFAIACDGPLDPDRFCDVMSFLIMRHAESLLRIKGLIRLAGEARPRLVNGVHDVFASEPTDAALPAGGFLVFIGIDLPEEAIRADLRSCASTG